MKCVRNDSEQVHTATQHCVDTGEYPSQDALLRVAVFVLVPLPRCIALRLQSYISTLLKTHSGGLRPSGVVFVLQHRF